MSLLKKILHKSKRFPALELPPLPVPAKSNKGMSLGEYIVEDRLDEIYQLRPNRRAQLWQAKPQKGHASFVALVTPGKENKEWLEGQLGTEGVALRKWRKARASGAIQQHSSSLVVLPFDTILNNRYLLRRKLVTDGVQETFKAWDIDKKRWVCCTVCIPHRNMEPIKKLVPRTFQTSSALVRSIHPNILNVLDENICKPAGIFSNYRRKANYLYYVVTEYVTDVNFTQYMRNLKKRAPLENLLTILCEMVDILEWLYNNRWFHGNIRPHYLWIGKKGDGRGHIYLSGFCMRKAGHDRNSTGGQLLRNSAEYGFPLYMAPEQIKSSKVDARTDQYCFGLMMAKLIWGQHPFFAKSKEEVFRKVMQSNPQLKKSNIVPHSLSDLVRRCFSRSPRKRFANPTEISDVIMQKVLPEADAKLQEMKLMEGEEIVSSEHKAIDDEDIAGSSPTPRRSRRSIVSSSLDRTKRHSTVRKKKTRKMPQKTMETRPRLPTLKAMEAAEDKSSGTKKRSTISRSVTRSMTALRKMFARSSPSSPPLEKKPEKRIPEQKAEKRKSLEPILPPEEAEEEIIAASGVVPTLENSASDSIEAPTPPQRDKIGDETLETLMENVLQNVGEVRKQAQEKLTELREHWNFTVEEFVEFVSHKSKLFKRLKSLPESNALDRKRSKTSILRSLLSKEDSGAPVAREKSKPAEDIDVRKSTPQLEKMPRRSEDPRRKPTSKMEQMSKSEQLEEQATGIHATDMWEKTEISQQGSMPKLPRGELDKWEKTVVSGEFSVPQIQEDAFDHRGKTISAKESSLPEIQEDDEFDQWEKTVVSDGEALPQIEEDSADYAHDQWEKTVVSHRAPELPEEVVEITHKATQHEIPRQTRPQKQKQEPVQPPPRDRGEFSATGESSTDSDPADVAAPKKRDRGEFSITGRFDSLEVKEEDLSDTQDIKQKASETSGFDFTVSLKKGERDQFSLEDSEPHEIRYQTSEVVPISEDSSPPKKPKRPSREIAAIELSQEKPQEVSLDAPEVVAFDNDDLPKGDFQIDVPESSDGEIMVPAESGEWPISDKPVQDEGDEIIALLENFIHKSTNKEDETDDKKWSDLKVDDLESDEFVWNDDRDDAEKSFVWEESFTEMELDEDEEL